MKGVIQMGTFGYEIFNDDVAYDIMDSLQNTSSLAEDIQQYLEVANTQDYLEYEEAYAVLVCAAVMDAVINDTEYQFDGFSDSAESEEQVEGGEQFQSWIANFTASELEDLRIIAVEALQKVLTSSELQELWTENADFDQWNTTVEEVIDRLAK